MAGIDNIISLIKQDAENEAKAIISEAKAKAEAIIAEGTEEGAQKAENIQKSASASSEDIISRANSSAELEKRKAILLTKQSIISGIIDKAKEELVSLPDDEYFAVLYKLIKKYSIQDEGKIALGAKDLARVPADFEAKANEAASGKLSLKAEPEKITDGFLLLYGGIDINCTFDSLFADNSEEIIDKISSIVF